jgi:hypothetical protein
MLPATPCGLGGLAEGEVRVAEPVEGVGGFGTVADGP